RPAGGLETRVAAGNRERAFSAGAAEVAAGYARRVKHLRVRWRLSLSQFEYRPPIDGMRAIAVLAVLVFHFDESLLPGGFVGVDIFFAISGYLITSIVYRATQ